MPKEDYEHGEVFDIELSDDYKQGYKDASINRGVCIWKYEDEDYSEFSIFKTKCGNEFAFTSDSPEEHGFKFCMYCGGDLCLE